MAKAPASLGLRHEPHSVIDQGRVGKAMASADTDLICGVCTNLMSDPYSPPCGHTFCLRPCLLPHARAMTARCIRCHATFDLAELRPNYTIAAKLTLISMKREPQQDQMPKQQAKNKGDCVEEMSIGERRIRENPPFSMRCSTCRRPVGAKEVDTCHHCHCNICSQCREKHRDSAIQMAMTATSLRLKDVDLRVSLPDDK
ncbi:hypothetical protein EGR_08977 [Echinococcus granulosus]|uniref:Zinc finger C3HC4 RING-type domain-containing protein n=1 Tax=Echinococcus granulosus TaxID=6210 RepID=W6UCZ5_ECHGR|nr:hypothetical protein EGR_08977 [Echinococcus granulosus]EUB56172.1 hypothetical protein EGR_08977 [Echinococcus granulosus]